MEAGNERTRAGQRNVYVCVCMHACVPIYVATGTLVCDWEALSGQSP